MSRLKRTKHTKANSKVVAHDSNSKKFYLNRRYQAIAVAAVALVGAITVLATHAIAPVAVVNPEVGTVNTAASIGNDPNASDGSYIQFSQDAATACGATPSANQGTKITLTGSQGAEYHPTAVAHTTYDATNALWPGKNTDGTHQFWPITLNGSGPVCWYGGQYQGVWDYSGDDPTITWENPYHHNGGITIRTPNTLIDGFRADNTGDGINIDSGGSNFLIRNIYETHIKDDCIQNDFFNNGKIEDSLLDGCYDGFSAADYGAVAGKAMNNTWEIDNTLEHSDCSYPYYPKATGCYGLWIKGWYQSPQVGPKLILNNDIFRLDGKSNIIGGSDYVIPPNADLASCSNDIMVWTGPGNFPYTLPSCFTITKDVSVWDNAVAAWKTAHPVQANE